eukprot:SAG11_NODE_9050_length_949_cov_0.807059_2_plen_32_part_01
MPCAGLERLFQLSDIVELDHAVAGTREQPITV